MGYTTDFDGEFTITPPLASEHRAYLEAFDDNGSEVVDRRDRDPSVPHSECHWKPLDPDGTALGWDGVEKFTEYRGWLAYLIEHLLEPWGYRLDGTVTWQGEDDDDRGLITVEGNRVTVVGKRTPWPESEPSRSRYWPAGRQARLFARCRAGVDELALADEFGTWPSLVRTRLKRFGLRTNDETASATEATPAKQEATGDERSRLTPAELLARRNQALAEAREKRLRLMREQAERPEG
jgi:hypothetical protein